MEDLIEYVVRAIVRDPDAVEVTAGERRGYPVLRLAVAESDRGIVIGRQGRTIRAIETVLRASTQGGPTPGLEVAD